MVNSIVGNLIGQGRSIEVGAHVWQMIWFSLLSSLFALPMGILAVQFVVKGTFLETLTVDYLKIAVPLTFVFRHELPAEQFSK